MHLPLFIFGGLIVVGIEVLIVWQIMAGRAYARRRIEQNRK